MFNRDEMIRRLPGVYGRARSVIERVSNLGPTELSRFQKEMLSRVLRWAGDLPDGHNRSQTVDGFPFITKEDVRRDYRAYRRRNILPISEKQTSGTTGLALNLQRSIGCVVFEQALIDWFVAQAGHNYRTERVAVLRGDDVKPLDDTSPPFWKFSSSHTLVLSSNHLTPRNLPHYLEALKAFRPDILFAYPSSADHLSNLVLTNGVSLRFPLILTSSESLPNYVRRHIGQTLGGPVIDYYGQGERVAFAYSLEPNRYRFHPAYGLTELLDASIAAEAGRRSMEIVGTPFHNAAQILIRYRTGDFIELPDSGETALRDIANGMAEFSGVAGRVNEMLFGPNGEVLVAINQIARGLEQFGRMQLIQDAPDHIDILIKSPSPGSPAAAAQILARARLKIPTTMAVEVKFVEDLARTPMGKTPLVIRRI